MLGETQSRGNVTALARKKKCKGGWEWGYPGFPLTHNDSAEKPRPPER